jgi:hemoglobin
VEQAVPTPTTLFDLLGGREGVTAIVADFYRRVADDPGLRPVYPEDLTPGRVKLTLFLEQWLGGEPVYSERYGHPRLRRRHFPYVIDERHAGRWLRHMREAMQAAGVPADAQRVIFERLAPLAHHMVNAEDAVPREPIGDVRLT